MSRLYAEWKNNSARNGYGCLFFQPSAGARQYTGLLLIKAYHENEEIRSATSFLFRRGPRHESASAAMVGYSVREVKTNASGMIDMDAFKAAWR